MIFLHKYFNLCGSSIAEDFQFRTALVGVEALNNWGRFFNTTSGYAEFSNISAEALEGTGTGVDSHNNLARTFKLEQNYPNPFNPTTIISYSIPEKSHVNLKIYNVLGEHVATLVNQDMSTGDHSINWNAQDKNGHQVASGFYIYQIKTGKFTKSHKMLLLR